MTLSLLLLSAIYMAYINYYWGEGDLNRFHSSGKFESGYTEFLSDDFKNKVGVFYPIDLQVYRERISSTAPYWLREGN